MKEISITKYRALEGIRVLANQLNQQLEQLVLATAEITGEELDEINYGFASDFIFSSDEKVSEHLRKLGIKVNRKKI